MKEKNQKINWTTSKHQSEKIGMLSDKGLSSHDVRDLTRMTLNKAGQKRENRSLWRNII